MAEAIKLIPINGPVRLAFPFRRIVGFSFGGYTLTLIGGSFVNVFDEAVLEDIPATEKINITVIVEGDINALDFGSGWHAETIFNMINKATIRGLGGRGAGAGPAQDGFNAIELQGLAVTVDNALGNIWGGGGGGGSGGAADEAPGGGGVPNGRAGGPAATDGTPTAPGVGGDDGMGNIGGNGGDYGEAGQFGSPPGTMPPGAAGKAINLGGGSVTWLSGNNPTQVKGAVS